MTGIETTGFFVGVDDAFGLTAVILLSFADVDAAVAASGTAAGVVSARAQVGSLRGRERLVGVVGDGATAAVVTVRVVVRANVASGLPSETGDADGGVGTVWRTSASRLVSDWIGVC